MLYAIIMPIRLYLSLPPDQHIMKKISLVLLLLLTTTIFSPVIAEEANLTIEDAWISEAPPVSKVMVAYMDIINNSDKQIVIATAGSFMYSSIEFHETVHEDGMARMVRYDEITVPAHGKVQFKRGGKHFMLFNPTKHLKAGDTVKMKLTTNDKKTKIIFVPVKKAQH